MHPETPSDPQKHSLQWSGERLAYTDEGAGPLIVAIPGLPGTVRDFRWLSPALTEHFRVVRVELPGFGDSTRGAFRGMSIAARAQPVAAVIEHLGAGPAIVLGHSSGGTVAAQLANVRPDLTAGCAFLAVPGARPHYPLKTYRALAGLLRRPLGRRGLRGPMRWLYRRIGFPAYLSDDERTFTTLDAAATDFRAHADNVRRLGVPLFMAWAADDRLIPIAIYEELSALAPPGLRMRFPTGGHNIQKTQAVEIAAGLRSQFLR